MRAEVIVFLIQFRERLMLNIYVGIEEMQNINISFICDL